MSWVRQGVCVWHAVQAENEDGIDIERTTRLTHMLTAHVSLDFGS